MEIVCVPSEVASAFTLLGVAPINAKYSNIRNNVFGSLIATISNSTRVFISVVFGTEIHPDYDHYFFFKGPDRYTCPDIDSITKVSRYFFPNALFKCYY